MNNHFAKLNDQTLAASAITFAVVLFVSVVVAVRQEHRMEQWYEKCGNEDQTKIDAVDDKLADLCVGDKAFGSIGVF